MYALFFHAIKKPTGPKRCRILQFDGAEQNEAVEQNHQCTGDEEKTRRQTSTPNDSPVAISIATDVEDTAMKKGMSTDTRPSFAIFFVGGVQSLVQYCFPGHGIVA